MTQQNPTLRPIASSDVGSGGPQERLRQSLDEMADLIPHPPIMSQGLLRACCILRQFWRIIESYMNDLGFSRKYRAILAGMIADGHHVIEFNVLEGIDVLRLVIGNIHAGFGHDFDGAWIQAMGFDAGGVGLDLVAFERAGEALGHLAAAGVAGAEEEDSEL